jgi:hypothetical protein
MADINSHNKMGYNDTQTIGWRPSCSCDKIEHEFECHAAGGEAKAPIAKASMKLSGLSTRRSVDARDVPEGRANRPTPIPATVLDPFLGSGTTAMVADQLGRHCIGIELSQSYAAMAERRLRNDAGLFADVAAE